MTNSVRHIAAVLFAAAAMAQAQTHPAAPVPPSSAGLESPWEARKILANTLKADEQLKPLLAGINPQEWYDKKGAPSTYIVQWQTAQQSLSYVEISGKLFSQKPDDLKLALDLYFRLEAFETSARSVDEGAQRYGDRAIADKLTSLLAQNFDNRQRLRDYIGDLAANLQQNYKIADEEAQRCRGIIGTQPPPRTTRRTK